MTLGNLQYYFPSRESLVEAVVRREAESDISELKLLCKQGDGRQVDFERFVNHLVTKWRGDSGKIFGLLNYLSLHNDAFRAIYYEVYDQFYAALVDVIRCTNPALSEAESLLRARVVTALVDGAVLQLGQSGKRKFLREIARVARETVMAGS